MQGKAGDDDLGRIVQGGVEQAADGFSQAAGKRLGCPAHQLGKRHDRQRRGRENQDRVETEPVEPDRDRNEQEQPVQAHGGYSMIDPTLLDATPYAYTSRRSMASARRLAAWAPSIKPRTAALSLGMPRATSATGKTTP